MASIERRTRNGQLRWYARYRDPADKQCVKVFDRKLDAERFLTTVESAKLTGNYIDPMAARLAVGVWAKRWLDGQTHLKPSTRERYAGILREHIDPRWATTKLADVTHSGVQTWISEVSAVRSPATTRKVHRVLSLILAMAVKDERLVRNPAAGISLPRVNTAERMYLTHSQVGALADECGEYRLVVLFLAYTGVRFGELAALRVGRLDLMRRRASVSESVTLVRGVQTWGTPKGHARRDVAIPRFLVDALAEQVAGRPQDALVFAGAKGGALRSQVFQRAVLTDASERLGLVGLHPHALRHTAASLAIASGANVKVVQQMLGHKSATMTLDLYGHLFPDQLDDVAERLDAAARAADVYPLCTEAEILPLPVGAETQQTPRISGGLRK
jgi:integrase